MRAHSNHIWSFIIVCITIIFSSTLTTSVVKVNPVDRQADLIIFSYDRPLQLYALLESITVYMRSLGCIHIVCRCSDKRYADAYAQVWHTFPEVIVHNQAMKPEEDFKQLTMHALQACPHDYVIFAVDDMIVTDFVDCAECIDLLEKHAAYGFFLRMGKNLDACYSMARKQPLPPFMVDDGNICVWQFGQGMYDWNYPHTVDMTFYRKSKVIHDLSSFAFRHPTDLEGTWSSRWRLVAGQLGICFVHTKVVNLPLNLVQNIAANNHMNFMSCSQLLNLFNQGKKIDIAQLYAIDNKSAHIAYIPTFIERT